MAQHSDKKNHPNGNNLTPVLLCLSSATQNQTKDANNDSTNVKAGNALGNQHGLHSAGSSTTMTSTDERPAAATPYPFWHTFVAGGVAGAGSRVVTAPLDLIRIRRQLAPPVVYPSESLWDTWTNIVRNEGGVAALFRGNMAAIFVSGAKP